MSRVPDYIEGLGKATLRLRQNPALDVRTFSFTSDSYFVWSRLDGHTSIRDVILMVGFPTQHTIEILRSLRSSGAVLAPGETPQSVAIPGSAAPSGHASSPAPSPARGPAASSAAAAAAASTPRGPARETAPEAPRRQPRATTVDPVAGEPVDELGPEEAAAMSETVDLPDESKLRIIAMRRKVTRLDYFTLFGVPRDADTRAIKRAYYRISKEFHPDRYFGKNTGSFGPWLAEIFDRVSKAFDVLVSERTRERYLATLSGSAARAGDGVQTPVEHARELFDRACSAEVGGDFAGALKLFAAAVRVDPQVRYLGRAARCAMAAKELALAEEYAKKAAELEPSSPSLARILADVYRAAGKLEQAEKTLVFALGLKSENDVLVKELSTDLAEVRATLAQSPR